MNNLLSTKGLTSSEANHITNIVKELVKSLSLEKMKLFTSKVIKLEGEFALDEAVRVDTWVSDVKRVGELYALSAWLKSAIKHKEQLLDTVSQRVFKSFVEKPTLEEYEDTPSAMFEDYLDTLTVKERNEFLSAEAKASHIGKFIHNFDKVRDLSEQFQPTHFQQIGNEVVTVKNKRLYSNEELLGGFFELQKEHREVEKVVNYWKSKHKDWVKLLLDDNESNNQRIMYSNSKKTKTYDSEVEEERLSFFKKVREDKQHISNLKIVIPSELQGTLDYVNLYAKK